MSEKQKLLIVDDSELNRDILKEILGSRYDYMEAENGSGPYRAGITPWNTDAAGECKLFSVKACH